MDKSFIVFLIIGGIFFYFVMGVVDETKSEDDKYLSTTTQHEKYAKFMTVDSIGQSILDVTNENQKMQVEAWNHSELKQEFLDIFPDFDTMRTFVKNRVRGEYLIERLTDQISKVEDAFFSGTMNAEQAKRALEHLK